ncbi:hypothetical protein ACJJTC_011382 [Scirpophaga incertulas]
MREMAIVSRQRATGRGGEGEGSGGVMLMGPDTSEPLDVAPQRQPCPPIFVCNPSDRKVHSQLRAPWRGGKHTNELLTLSIWIRKDFNKKPHSCLKGNRKTNQTLQPALVGQKRAHPHQNPAQHQLSPNPKGKGGKGAQGTNSDPPT